MTTAQSRDVATAMWQAWETALINDDTRALTQLISPGAMLQGTLDNCAYPVAKCAPETQTRPIEWLTTIVPVQTSYPIDFLAEIRTDELVQGNNGIDTWQQWLELQILTKASPSSAWMLSFDTGYNSPDGSTASLLPFAQGAGPSDPDAGYGYYNTAAQSPAPPYPAAQFLPLLAAYWQSYAVSGSAPDPSAFIENGDTSGYGQAVAQVPGAYAGYRESVSFSVDPTMPTWSFLVSGGYPMVCGSVVETQTDQAIGSHFLDQNPDESHYGPPLASGLYSSIVSQNAHDTCVYVVLGGLDAAGLNTFSYATTGTKVAPAPIPKGSSSLSDLDTAYGVLDYELTQYGKRLNTCEKEHDRSCPEAIQEDIAGVFGQFSDSLMSYGFPSSDERIVNALNGTSVQLSREFQNADASYENLRRLSPQIDSKVAQFKREYELLVQQLSPTSQTKRAIPTRRSLT